MSQENVEIVWVALDADNRGDFEAMLRTCGPRLELDWSRSIGPQRGVYGLEEIPQSDLGSSTSGRPLNPFGPSRRSSSTPVTMWYADARTRPGRDRIEVRAAHLPVDIPRWNRCAGHPRPRAQEALEAAGLAE